MRFISKYQRYSYQARPEKAIVTKDGFQMIGQSSIVCQFEHGGINNWESDAALKHFSFKGLPEGVEPALRLSVFDTDWTADQEDWDVDTKQYVEERLLNGVGLNHDYILVERPRLAAPWPTYEKTKHKGPKSVASVLAEKVAEDGFDPEYVIAYERENQARADVIEALEGLLVPSESGDVEVAA